MRLIADGLIYHAINRGNHRQTVFHSEGDDAAFLKAIADLKERKESLSTSTAIALAATCRSSETGLPYGATGWVDRLCRRLKVDLTIRPHGRPRKDAMAHK